MEKEEVLEKLSVLGFDIEEVPNLGYIFKYEGLTLLYMPDDDEDFLRFAAPNVFEVTEENRPFVMEMINETNKTVKYSKVCAYVEHVWVFYEYHLFDGTDLEDVIEHILLLIKATVAFFHRLVEGGSIEDFKDERDKE